MISAPSIPDSAPRWLHRFAVFVVAYTLVLIGLGGLVTSKEVGMAVPDWPTTFGHNMFLFPIRQWEGGILNEHVHRLFASGLGMLTLVLAVWVELKDRRGWVKGMSRLAAVLVVVQGILGGARVALNDLSVLGIPGSSFFGVIHAATAQIFLCLVGTIALATGLFWKQGSIHPVDIKSRWLPWITGLILVQLLVAATMRHQHAGLAIPDFPLAYGHLYPPSDPGFVTSLNQQRTEIIAYAPITAFQIHLQMVHRLLALVIILAVWTQTVPFVKNRGPLSGWMMFWSSLVLLQIVLGAATIWSGKSVVITTAHVVVGAGSLLTGALLAVVARRAKVTKPQDSPCPRPGPFLKESPVGAVHSASGLHSAS